jgi:hypothetical protein
MRGNENATEDASAFTNQCKAIANGWNCGVLVIHHSGLASENRMRGSTAFRGAFDTILKAESIDGALHKSVQLSMGQARDHEVIEPLVFELRKQIIFELAAAGGDAVDSLVPVRLHNDAHVSASKKAKLTPSQSEKLNLILDAINSSKSMELPKGHIEINGIYKSMQAAEFRIEKRNLRRDLEKFVQKGFIKMEIGEDGLVWFHE